MQNLTNYKLFLLVLFLFNLLGTFLGPLLCPDMYNFYLGCLYAYINFRLFLMFLNMLVGLTKFNRSVKRYDTIRKSPEQIQMLQNKSNAYHLVFVLPTYKEELQLLEQSLDRLAEHDFAKQYTVVLAMQAAQIGCEQKASILQKKYKSRFFNFTHTVHKLLPNQHKGKASNINYSCRQLSTILKQKNLKPQNVFVSIIDCDIWVSKAYPFEIIQRISQNHQQRNKILFINSQITGRSTQGVYGLIESTDDFASLSNWSSQLHGFGNLNCVISSYCLSYQLLLKIDFWETSADAISQDSQTIVRAYTKQGGLKTIFITTPMLLQNLSTGKGFFSDLKARFWQAQRHGQTICTVARMIKRCVENPLRFRGLIYSLNLGQIYFIAIISFLSALCTNLQKLVLGRSVWELESLILLSNFLMIIHFPVYYYIKFRASQKLYSFKQSSNYFYCILRGALFQPLIVVGLCSLPFMLSFYNVFKMNRVFTQTEKVRQINKILLNKGQAVKKLN